MLPYSLTKWDVITGLSPAAGHSDGDGQYFHYLTKWAFALSQVAAATGESRYLRWAIELMHTAHRAFTYKVRCMVNTQLGLTVQ
jgi:hypothetical protein